MKARIVLLIVLGLAGGLLVPGCLTYKNPTTGTKAYTYHTLRAEVDAPMPVVYAAALQAADSLDLTVGRADQGAFGAVIRAVDVLDNVVDIRLKVLSPERTGLAIDIGVFGDRRKSIMVFDRIMANLAEKEPALVVPSVWWGPPVTEPLTPEVP